MTLIKRASMTLASVLFAATAFAGAHVADKDIVETAIEADDFNTLVAAVQAAGLVETLQGDGPFTVFAPNDAAFAKIPSDTLNGLLEDPEALGAILGLHVVSGKVMAEDVVGMSSAQTITGETLNISVMGGNVMVNGATVIATDIETSNGVIHVIDTVITE
ncbi:fasciclin domain-containing protein [Saccharospirillum impatiens]|uniref:fasciclin domain-containing protein n=1 Tax=Saccharospirillum impatiens TaxID=169438 RepID=UPI0003FD1A6B|nr:fasciclin domain-containing protein [Saccharospirillum impatiens]